MMLLIDILAMGFVVLLGVRLIVPWLMEYKIIDQDLGGMLVEQAKSLTFFVDRLGLSPVMLIPIVVLAWIFVPLVSAGVTCDKSRPGLLFDWPVCTVTVEIDDFWAPR